MLINYLSMKNTRILVTGCAGFIPSFVTEKLLDNGANVIGIDNFFNGRTENMNNFMHNKKFTFVEGDIRDRKLMDSLINKSDMVYHAATRGLGVSADNPAEEAEVNINATIQMLDSAKRHAIKKFIYTSSASVYGNTRIIPEKETDPAFPLSPYGVSKLAAERYCMVYHHLFNLPVVCLRYFNTYGPRQKKDSVYGGVVSIFIHNAIKNKPLSIYGTGEQTRDFTFVEDTVAATIQSFINDRAVGNVINVSRGKESTVNELAVLIKKISKNNNLRIEYTKGRLIDNIQRRLGDISLAKKLLNYNPQTTLEEGLSRTFSWYSNELRVGK